MPSKVPAIAVTAPHVGRAVELPAPGPRHAAGAHAAQRDPGHGVDHGRPRRTLGERTGHEPQQVAERHPAPDLEPEVERRAVADHASRDPSPTGTSSTTTGSTRVSSNT